MMEEGHSILSCLLDMSFFHINIFIWDANMQGGSNQIGLSDMEMASSAATPSY